MIVAIQLETLLSAHGLLLGIAAFLVSVCLILVIILYVRRTISVAKEKKRSDLQFRYQYLLYDALVEAQAENASTNFLEVALQLFQREQKQNKYIDQQILTDIILNLKKSLSGSAQNQLLRLAHALELPEYSLKKLRERKFSVRAQGLHEISALQVDRPEVKKEIESLNPADTSHMAQEVILALAKLDSSPNLAFLSSLNTPLSEWLQIRLHHYLRSIERHQLPNFSRWLTSENESIVLFALRMIAEFQQHSAGKAVLHQLGSSSPLITAEAIKTVGQLQLSEAIPTLMNLAQHEDTDVQLASLQVISQLGNQQQATSLSHLHQHPNYWVRRATSKAVAQLQSNAESL
ncbi:HEAT repeat domain-containing protein [Tunicatimonas pelagia]|uniref:HEAT repeat domain-containing protein n=1 Tax=Tunicatimonas pelagia TaxID=931531 RepID=UPI002666F47D|nr:HEAT repeat domain-containing protein [Tunicatimonas pelagia]WKN45855.1 HEAT repeat domain-containing protein [Tunicatimonas pelagia]